LYTHVKPKVSVHQHDRKLTYGESKTFPWGKVSGEYAVLGIVQGAVSDSSNNLSKDKKRVAVEMIRRRTSHDDSSTEMECSQYCGQQGSTPPID
jgi:hypothetical protein